ncbi:MAG: hypothetical protein GY777_03945, partial [Candidatus Brocadiaceae bacterium]|nr:hypothetical protein [Candidatus Brocadiaceae bacterium]
MNKSTWVRVDNERVVDRAVMDYVLIERGMVGRLLGVHVYRGKGGGMSDHYLVEGRLRVMTRWMGGKNVKGVRKVVNVRRLYDAEKEREYQEKVKVEYEAVKNERVESVEAEWLLFKNTVMRCMTEVCGKRRVGGFVRKGSEWWSEDVKKVVAEKRRAFEEWLQKKDDLSYERYRVKRNLVKQIVKEAKRVADMRWGMRLSGNFKENKKMFWKEVKRVRKGETGSEKRVKDLNDQLLVESEDVGRRWAEYFDEILNVEDKREVKIVAVGGERGMPVFGERNDANVSRKEVQDVVNDMKVRKVAGLDGCDVECLKKGGVSVVEWLCW